MFGVWRARKIITPERGKGRKSRWRTRKKMKRREEKVNVGEFEKYERLMKATARNRITERLGSCKIRREFERVCFVV